MYLNKYFKKIGKEGAILKRIKLNITIVSCLLLTVTSLQLLRADEDIQTNEISETEVSNEFMVIEEDGSVSFHQADPNPYEPDAYEIIKTVGEEKTVVDVVEDKEEAQSIVEGSKKLRSPANYSIQSVYSPRAANYGVAQLKGTFRYKNSNTGGEDIFAGSSASDAAYLQTNSDGSVKVKVAETIINVPAANVQVSEYNGNSKVSHYYVSNGKLYHRYYYNNATANASIQVGYQLTYLNANVNYFSYDGHYFYTSYTKMIDDYRNNTYANSVNPKSPHYNYYEFLSHRAPSTFSATDLNTYFNKKKGDTSSKLYNQGTAFINAQNARGVNASLMFGTAILESGWGLSKYALDRNNLFGHNAVDSNPDAATRYASVQACLEAHANAYISSGYLNPGDYRYRGPHLGNKNSGVSSKYASDPYTGEKKAYFSYEINELVKKNDYNKYQIGITNARVPVYNTTSSSKKVLYYTGTGSYNTALSNFPITILGTESGADGKVYYKIMSDPVLNSARTGLDVRNTYNASRDYAYVEASQFQIVNPTSQILSKVGLYNNGTNVYGFKVGSDVSTIANAINSASAGSLVSIKNKSGAMINNGAVATGMTITIKEEGVTTTYTVIIRGDSNGDGRVSTLDYVFIKNHILKISTLNGIYASAADINRDGRVSTLDYVMVKNQILGISNINQ